METLRTLPGDDIRQIMWRFADRFDLQMIVQSTRSVARGPVARLVANGARNSHDWTDEKNELLKAYDESGITGAFMDPEEGGIVEGPKNLLLSLIAFELAWVDGGAATGSLAGNLALSPIHEKGTPEQKAEYMSRSNPANGNPIRGAFGLTEPLPYVGVDTNSLSGRISIAKWEEGQEPVLQVEKRGRFITNMEFANFVTAAVDTGDKRIKSSCMVILEDTDEGSFDSGTPTRKMVHQLSSTSDPVLSLKVPANRIIGGYTIQDGVIVPNFTHGEIIEAVFHRTRVTVALMTSAKLLSAIEPVIRYQRGRFRGGNIGGEGSPRHDQGLQMKEDALHRLVDVWATGEASASLGFEAARVFDTYDAIERAKNEFFETQGIVGPRKQMMALRRVEKDAIALIELEAQPEGERDQARYEELKSNTLVDFLTQSTVANVFCPACKLWNTGHGANMMREAVSLMGGYGITEDCPGFLGHKWMDAQLEATYEGPEAVQRRQLSLTMTSKVFLAHFRQWIKQLRGIASEKPSTGACTLASAMELWIWTLEHLQTAKDADGTKLYSNNRQGVTFPLADALSWLLAARQMVLDVLEVEKKGPENPVVAEGLEGLLNFYFDLCHVQTARAAGEVGRICAELTFGYNRHPSWGDEGCVFAEGETDALEGVMPGLGACACDSANGNGHAKKAGPCVRFDGLETFARLRIKLDGCLTGSRLAKDRAARAVAQVMIPEALDYPI